MSSSTSRIQPSTTLPFYSLLFAILRARPALATFRLLISFGRRASECLSRACLLSLSSSFSSHLLHLPLLLVCYLICDVLHHFHPGIHSIGSQLVAILAPVSSLLLAVELSHSRPFPPQHAAIPFIADPESRVTYVVCASDFDATSIAEDPSDQSDYGTPIPPSCSSSSSSSIAATYTTAPISMELPPLDTAELQIPLSAESRAVVEAARPVPTSAPPLELTALGADRRSLDAALGDETCSDLQNQLPPTVHEVSNDRQRSAVAKKGGGARARARARDGGRRRHKSQDRRHASCCTQYSYEEGQTTRVPAPSAPSTLDRLSNEEVNELFSRFQARTWAKIRGSQLLSLSNNINDNWAAR